MERKTMKKGFKIKELKIFFVLACTLVLALAQVNTFAEEVTEPTSEPTQEVNNTNEELANEVLSQPFGIKSLTRIANPGDYLISPETIGPEQDGYAYIKPGKVINQYGEETWQIFAYNHGHSSGGRSDPGWTAYVPSGSKSLFLVGDLSNHLTLGVGNTNNSTNYTYKTAIFDGGNYTGDIIKIEGSETGSMILTNTGEIWYTGNNDRSRFGTAANNRTSAQVNRWLKMKIPANVEGTVVDAVLAYDAIFIVTSEGHLYAQGGELNDYFGAANHKLPEDSNWTSTTQDFKRVVLPDGSSAKRLWALGSTEDDYAYQYERAFIVSTDTGYFGSGDSDNGRKLVGVGGKGVGLHKIQYGNTDGTKVDMPANFAKQIEMYGDHGITHFLATNGKVYTTGYSQWGNVSGTRYTSFRGWPTSSSVRFGNTSGSTATSAVLNRWDTNQFEENIDLVDVEKIFPGMLTISYEKTDGTIMMGSELGAASGSSVKNYQANGATYDLSRCLGSNDWCYTYYSIPIEGDGEYYFQSTNWNKTAIMQRQYIVGLWMGSIAIDQDGFLRAAVRSRSFQETAARSQLIFPIVNSDSTIRTTENYSSVSDSTYLSDYYNNNNELYRTNARVVGEYMLYDGINLAQPTHTYVDGDGEGNTTNPASVSIGPFYGKRYGLDPTRPGEASYDIYTNYAVYKYDEATETRTSTIVTPTNAKVTDAEVVLDVGSYDPGTYEVVSYRYVTDSTGDQYSTVSLSTFFEVTPAPHLTVPPLTVITTDGYKIITDSGVSALVKPDQDVSSKIYIESYSLENTQLGTWSTGTIDGVERKTEFTLNAITEFNAGIYQFNFKVDANGYSDTASGTYIVNDGRYEVGTEYILKAKDFLIGYEEFLDTDAFLKQEASVKVYDLQGNDVTSSVTVSVEATTWTQEYGTNHDITFSITNSDGTTLSKTVTGSVDNKPYFVFTPKLLQLTYGEITADSFKTGAVAKDEEDGDITDFTVSTDLTTLEVGVYNVDYTAVDSNGNSTTESRVVIISDGNFVVGTNAIIYATDFQIRKSQYSGEPSTVLNQAQVKVYKLTDGTNITASVGFNLRYPDYVAEIGTYDVWIKASHDDNAEITIQAEIITGAFPVISGANYTELDVDAAFSATEGVTVTDTEDGTITEFAVSGTVDTSTPGVYVLTYTAEDIDENVTTENRVVFVKGDDFVVGDTYILKATNFEKIKAYVSLADSDIINDAGVKVYDKTTGQLLVAQDLVSVNKGSYSAELGDYDITFTITSDSKITKTIVGTVTNGQVPILTVPPFTEVGEDGFFNPTAGVSATDPEDGAITTITRDVAAVDTTVPGVTVITYSVTDSDGNTTTAKQVVLVSNDDYATGDQYILYAQDFEKLISEVVVGDDGDIITSAQTKVWDKSTGELLTTLPGITVTKNGYTDTADTYTINLAITTDTAANLDVEALVHQGEVPVITFDPALVEVSVNGFVDVKDGATALDIEQGNMTPSLVANPTEIDTSSPGIQIVTYSVTDEDGNEVTKKRVFLVKDETYVVGTDYILQASNFKRTVSLVDTSDEGIISAAQVRVYSVKTGTELTGFDRPALDVDGGTYTNVVGVYNDVVISLTSETTTARTIEAEVITGAIPTITGPTYDTVAVGGTFNPLEGISATDEEDGAITVVANPSTIDTSEGKIVTINYSATDSDGNVGVHTQVLLINDGTFIVGDKYILKANDFRIRLSLVDTTGAKIIEEAGIQIFDKATGEELTVTDYVTIDGGTYAKVAQDHTISLTVTTDTKLNTSITATVHQAEAPVVTARDIVLSPDPDTPVRLTAGHTVVDDFDNEDYFFDTVVFSPETVSSTEVGIKKVNFTLTDSDENEVSGHFFVVIVDDTISVGDKYIIQATGFEKRVSEVGTADAQEIKDESQFIAYDRVSGEDVTSSINVSVATGGYKDTPGTYTARFTSTEDPNLDLSITATVVGGESPVFVFDPETVLVQKGATFTATDGVTITDDYDTLVVGSATIEGTVDVDTAGVYKVTYSITDSDKNTTTTTRVVVVTDETVGIGDNYIIVGQGFTKRISEVTDTSDAALIAASEVKVYDKSTGDIADPVPGITVTNGGYSATPSDYNVTFTVTSDTAATVGVVAKVTEGSKPTLTVKPFSEISVNQSFEPTDGASAFDLDDGDIDVVVVKGINPAVAGVQVVEYSATDSDGNVATAQQVVVVNDGTLIIGDTYILQASDFSIRVALVDTADAKIIEEAGIKIFDKATGQELTVTDYVAIDSGTYSSDVQEHTISLTVASDAKLDTTIIATVYRSDAPTLQFYSMVIDLPYEGVIDHEALKQGGYPFVEDDFDDEETLLNSVTFSPETIPTEVGVYEVTATIEDSDGNQTTSDFAVVVNDGTISSSRGYFLRFVDFEVRSSQVDTSDLRQDFITRSEFAAYDSHTGKPIEDISVFEIDLAGYSDTPGVYSIHIKEPTDSYVWFFVEGKVIQTEAPVFAFDPETVLVQKGADFTATDGVTITDDYDTLTINDVTINNPVDVNTAGVYQVTYSVSDSDGNTTTKTRVVVVTDETVGVGDNYIIVGNGFSKRVSEVTDTSDAALILASEVKVYDKSTGEIADPVPGITVSNGGYTAVVNDYDVTFTVTDDTAATVAVVANVNGGSNPVISLTESVNDVMLEEIGTFNVLAGVSAIDNEDGDLTTSIEIVQDLNPLISGVQVIKFKVVDSDGSIGTAERVVIVNDGTFVVGDTYILKAENFTKYTSEVVVEETAVAIAANAEVYEKLTGKRLDNPETLVSVDLGEYSSEANAYTMTVSVIDETALTKEIVGTVITGELPVITYEEFSEVQRDETFDIFEGVSATDAEDGDIEVFATVDSIDTSILGTQVITYYAIDSHGNETRVTRVILVNDGTFVVGENYIIKANDFEKRVSQVVVSVDEVLAAASPIVIDKQTGLGVSTEGLLDVDFGSYQAATGVYDDISIYVIGDDLATVTVTATVVADPIAPKPTDPPVNLGCGVNSTWNEDIKQCVCDEGYSNWQGAGEGCLVATPRPTATPTPTAEVTATPEPTETAEITPTPTPEVTATPLPTEEPVVVEKGGSNSIMNILMLILTLIVTAWIGVRKFERSAIIKGLSVFVTVGLVIFALLTTNLNHSWQLFTEQTIVFVAGFIVNACLGVISVVSKD